MNITDYSQLFEVANNGTDDIKNFNVGKLFTAQDLRDCFGKSDGGTDKFINSGINFLTGKATSTYMAIPALTESWVIKLNIKNNKTNKLEMCKNTFTSEKDVLLYIEKWKEEKLEQLKLEKPEDFTDIKLTEEGDTGGTSNKTAKLNNLSDESIVGKNQIGEEIPPVEEQATLDDWDAYNSMTDEKDEDDKEYNSGILSEVVITPTSDNSVNAIDEAYNETEDENIITITNDDEVNEDFSEELIDTSEKDSNDDYVNQQRADIIDQYYSTVEQIKESYAEERNQEALEDDIYSFKNVNPSNEHTSKPVYSKANLAEHLFLDPNSTYEWVEDIDWIGEDGLTAHGGSTQPILRVLTNPKRSDIQRSDIVNDDYLKTAINKSYNSIWYNETGQYPKLGDTLIFNSFIDDIDGQLKKYNNINDFAKIEILTRDTNNSLAIAYLDPYTFDGYDYSLKEVIERGERLKEERAKAIEAGIIAAAGEITDSPVKTELEKTDDESQRVKDERVVKPVEPLTEEELNTRYTALPHEISTIDLTQEIIDNYYQNNIYIEISSDIYGTFTMDFDRSNYVIVFPKPKTEDNKQEDPEKNGDIIDTELYIDSEGNIITNQNNDSSDENSNNSNSNTNNSNTNTVTDISSIGSDAPAHKIKVELTVNKEVIRAINKKTGKTVFIDKQGNEVSIKKISKFGTYTYVDENGNPVTIIKADKTGAYNNYIVLNEDEPEHPFHKELTWKHFTITYGSVKESLYSNAMNMAADVKETAMGLKNLYTNWDNILLNIFSRVYSILTGRIRDMANGLVNDSLSMVMSFPTEVQKYAELKFEEEKKSLLQVIKENFTNNSEEEAEKKHQQIKAKKKSKFLASIQEKAQNVFAYGNKVLDDIRDTSHIDEIAHYAVEGEDELVNYINKLKDFNNIYNNGKEYIENSYATMCKSLGEAEGHYLAEQYNKLVIEKAEQQIQKLNENKSLAKVVAFAAKQKTICKLMSMTGVNIPMKIE